jgi:hypothetical protein
MRNKKKTNENYYSSQSILEYLNILNIIIEQKT